MHPGPLNIIRESLRAAIILGLLAATVLPGAVAAPLRILPVGDSITAGYTDNPAAGGTGGWTVPFEFGYRRELYRLLEGAGYDFVFVGGSLEPLNNVYGDPTRGGTASPTLDLRAIGQNGHRGYGGIRIPEMNANIISYLNTDAPDLILLMIGINGMDAGSPAELAALVNNIVTTRPGAHLILAQITPMSSNLTYAGKNADLVSYNTYIRQTLVPALQAQRKKVSTIDHYRNFLTDPGNPASAIDASLYSNGINHPTNPAYDTMAGTWFAGIQAVIPAPATPVLSEDEFLPGIAQDTAIGTFTHSPSPVDEAFGYSFAAGPGDTDNGKFTISGTQLLAGAHGYNGDPPGTRYFIRVKATGLASGRAGNGTFTLTAVLPDTDSDQIPDAWEKEKAGGLADLTASGDLDLDGLTDVAEYHLSAGAYPGIDPTDPDTGRDGLPDGPETAGAGRRPPTHPTLADTDGDGIGDLNEDRTGVYIGVLQTGTNPVIADTDGDGAGDRAEILLVSDPHDISSPGPPAVTGVNSTAPEAYAGEVSGTDLLHGLTGADAIHSGWNLNNSASPAKLNDGLHGPGVVPVEGGWSLAPSSVSTYTLLPGAGSGWDISGITTIADWPGGGYGNQRYQVSVRRTGETGFNPLATVDYQPFTATGSGGSRVRLSDSGGTLARGVQQIRFTMLTTQGSNGRSVYRELDVFGTPTAVASPRILAFEGPSTAGVRPFLTWLSWAAKTYKVEWSGDLQVWSMLDAGFPSGGVTTTLRQDHGPALVPRAFYRISENP